MLFMRAQASMHHGPHALLHDPALLSSPPYGDAGSHGPAGRSTPLRPADGHRRAGLLVDRGRDGLPPCHDPSSRRRRRRDPPQDPRAQRQPPRPGSPPSERARPLGSILINPLPGHADRCAGGFRPAGDRRATGVLVIGVSNPAWELRTGGTESLPLSRRAPAPCAASSPARRSP